MSNNATTSPAAGTSRRSFLTHAGATAAAVAAASVAGAGWLAPRPAAAVSPALTFAQIPGAGDVQVLNYALALEALEADLYHQALLRLTTGGHNALGKRIRGLGLKHDDFDVFYLREFGQVEADHRDFLNHALGKASILRTKTFRGAKFDFGFDQSPSRKTVMDTVLMAEQIGVTAYLGAVPHFASRTYLQTAGAILGTEARHASVLVVVNDVLFGEGNNVAPLATTNAGRDTPADPDTVLAQVSPFIVLG